MAEIKIPVDEPISRDIKDRSERGNHVNRLIMSKHFPLREMTECKKIRNYG